MESVRSVGVKVGAEDLKTFGRKKYLLEIGFPRDVSLGIGG